MSRIPPLFKSDARELLALLNAGLSLPLSYGGGLATHLPMALHALHELGAGPQRLRDFYLCYVRHFEGQSGPELVSSPPLEDWLAMRGQVQAYAALRASFSDAMEREGQGALLSRLLPDLLSAPGAAAFHGLIRLGHAVQADHAGELVAALAYWASRWQALAPPVAEFEALPLASWSRHLVEGAQGWHSERPLIQARMVEASHTALFQRLGAALAIGPDPPSYVAGLAQLALQLYLQSGNFTVLHMITGLRALRVLLPWVARPEAVYRPLAQAVVAAFLAARYRPFTARPALPARSWEAVIAAAITSEDEHVIKLVHACVEEAAFYGQDGYLEAAALATSPAASMPAV